MAFRFQNYEVLETIGTSPCGKCRKIRRRNDAKVCTKLVRFLIQFHGEILTTAKTCVISEVAVHIFLKQLFIEVEVIAVDI